MDSTSSTSALEIEDESETESNDLPPNLSSKKVTLNGFAKQDVSIDDQMSSLRLSDTVVSTDKDGKQDVSVDDQMSSLRLSDTVVSTDKDGKVQVEAVSKGGDTAESTSPPAETPTTHFINSSDLASQLLSNPNLAALRSANANSIRSPPILINTKCSGYFVEPVSFQNNPYPFFSNHSFFLDEMDGTFSFRGSVIGEDNMS